MSAAVFSVSHLNRLIKERLESGFALSWVLGEVSNLITASSGHVYFSLKDDQAQMRAVMFRNRAQLLGFRLTNGQKIEAQVLVSFYEPKGECQLVVESVRQRGAGALYEAFLALKAKCEKEGLFDPTQKRPLPFFPKTIGIITSPQAAALYDVLAVLKRRAPQIRKILYPALVQGGDAPVSLQSALKTALARKECDLLLICRGGGSLEDLWAFNDEALVRMIANASLPVVTGIGHDTDLSLSDLAADLRAPTPTAAAEWITPDTDALLAQLLVLEKRQARHRQRLMETRWQRVDEWARYFLHPKEKLSAQKNRLDALLERLFYQQKNHVASDVHRLSETFLRLKSSLFNTLPSDAKLNEAAFGLKQGFLKNHATIKHRLAQAASALSHLNPEAVLKRGYSLTQNAQGRILTNSDDVEPNDKIMVFLGAGKLTATVNAVIPPAPQTPSQRTLF